MIEILDVEQGSEEWLLARAGVPTASEFHTIQAKGRGGGESVTRRKYMMRLLGERLTGKPEEGYTNAHMERGKVMEGEARNIYAMVEEIEPQRVGFVRNHKHNFGVVGCSPDSFIGDAGMLEIKTKLASIQLEVLLAGEVPSEHIAQLQGALWVAEREWIDFCSYWPGLRPFIKRVYRDEVYIINLRKAVKLFCEEMETMRCSYTGEPLKAMEASA